MPVVPIRPGAARTFAPPPDPTFLMMAAATMHKEGRLVKDQSSYAPLTVSDPDTIRKIKGQKPIIPESLTNPFTR
jgi:hypothetical protein